MDKGVLMLESKTKGSELVDKIGYYIQQYGMTDWSGVLRDYRAVGGSDVTGYKVYEGEVQTYLADEDGRVIQELLQIISYREIRVTKTGKYVTFRMV